MIIRDAKPSEYQALAWLQIRSWRSVYRGIMPDWYLDEGIEEDQLTRWANLAPAGDDMILVAEDDGLLGFVTVWCRPNPFIDNLHVAPGLRSKGTGKLLMRGVANRLIAAGHNHVSLSVAAENVRAITFYQRLEGSFGEVEALEHGHLGPVNAIRVTWSDLKGLSQAG